jgi:amino acid efflux transporter
MYSRILDASRNVVAQIALSECNIRQRVPADLRHCLAMTTGRATAYYIGALLGPGLLLLPGLAARLAGPASILAWVGLLALSGLFALLFSSLGVRVRSRDGVAAYVAAALGPVAGRAIAWCFLAGVILGAPVVCLIGAGYVTNVIGGGRAATVGVAALLLVAVVAVTLGGARASSAVQLALIAGLLTLIVVAVAGSAGTMRVSRWTPFAPHGFAAVGSAASVLMLSFVGWEAIAPLIGRLHDPRRQLPRVVRNAFLVTSVVYLALAVATISVLGPEAGGNAPLAALLRVAIGPAGHAVAAAVAVTVTLAAVNAYLSGAAEMLAELASGGLLPVAVGVSGALALAGTAAGELSPAQLVTLPTALFITVYLGCTAAAVHLLPGVRRVAGVVACVAVAVVLGFSGWAILLPATIIAAVIAHRWHEIRRRRRRQTRNRLLMPPVRCG